MSEPAVADSSCLIVLDRIDRLDLLPRSFEPVIAPPKVVEEFGSHPTWLRQIVPRDLALVRALTLQVDSGEAEAIALALELGHRLILDDRRARRAAREMGVALIGTVGILVRAKKMGLILKLTPLIQDLEANEFFLSEALRAEALKLAGESVGQ